jgi:SAM-dependent methyltransferase
MQADAKPMYRDNAIDPGRAIDWSRASADYARFRSGPPDSFFVRLQALGIGLPGQRVLDLGTGTGLIARRLARQGSRVSGIDIAAGQLAQARRLAEQEGLAIDLREAPAEAPPFPDRSFDAVTANQCWLYFDKPRLLARLRLLLVPGGLIAVSHFSWLPRRDPIAAATEAIVLRHNPVWTGKDWDGEVPLPPSWMTPELEIHGFFLYDEAIPFTAEGWRGRIRACRGVGASLDPDEVEAVDRDLEHWLAENAGERFTVLHRLDATILSFRAN